MNANLIKSVPRKASSIFGRQILLVDDDPLIRRLLRTPLQDEGCKVFEMEDGIEASMWMIENRPDLIVVDVVMPKMDGIEFAHEMKRRFPKMPMLAISAGDTVMSQDFCLKFMKSVGAMEVLPKPFEIPSFISSIKRLLLGK